MPSIGDQITRPRSAVAERIERGDSRAHQRRRVYRCQSLRDQSQCAGGNGHIFGVAAIVG